MRRDPGLTPVDRNDLNRWTPVVARRIAGVGLFGPPED